MPQLEAYKTKDRVEYTVSAPGSSLFLTFHVENYSDEEPGQAWLTVRYHKKTDFTVRDQGEFGWASTTRAHDDYLYLLMLGGPAALYSKMTETYNNIANKLEGRK